MACAEPPAPGSLLATCREPGAPHLIAPRDLGAGFDEHAGTVVSLSANQIGAIAEQAAERFLDRHFGLTSHGDHQVNAHGADHLMTTTGSMLVVGETKGTKGWGVASQNAYQSGRVESFTSLLHGDQATPEWIDRDASLVQSGLSSVEVTGVVGCRVDVLSQTVDVWERDPATGSWDLVGTWDCPTADLVANAS